MQSKTLIQALSPLILCFFISAASANDTLKDWSGDKNLAKKMSLLPHVSSNAVKKMKETGIESPQKVGLISFYLWDTGEVKHNAMARQYGGTYERTTKLTPKGANHFATKLSQSGIPALKEEFAARGITLLEPIEFITTEEQVNAYVEFELPKGKLGGATESISGWMFRSPTVSSAAAGYSGIITHLWMDAKGLTALEELRQKLELDAMVVIGNTSHSDAKGVSISSIDFFMYGPNPIPKPPQKIAQIAWSPGATYSQATFGKGFKGAPLAELKKGNITKEFYEGYDVILKTLAREALNLFDEQYNK